MRRLLTLRGWSYERAEEAGKYPAEMRDRGVRMVFEAEQHCDSQWEAICSVAEKLGPTARRLMMPWVSMAL
jgi:hypothetical protein